MYRLLVERACSKLRTAIGDEAVLRLNITGDLQEMLDALEVIKPGLEDAEMQHYFAADDLGPWDVTTLPLAQVNMVTETAERIMGIVDELQDTTAPAAATVCAIM
jgi:hypothetical protein